MITHSTKNCDRVSSSQVDLATAVKSITSSMLADSAPILSQDVQGCKKIVIPNFDDDAALAGTALLRAAASTGGTGSGILVNIEDPTEMHSLTKSEVIIGSCDNKFDETHKPYKMALDQN